MSDPTAWGPAVGLRARRRARGLTQQQLADAIGRDYTYVSKIEHGHAAPSRSTARRIAAVLGCALPDPAPTKLPAGWVAVPVDALARIAAVVEAMDAEEALLGRIFGDAAERVDRVGQAYYALTADDRALLGLDGG